MRINTHQRQLTVPFSDERDHFHTAFTRVWTPSGGSGGGGVRPPPFGPRCRLFNIGPKVGPPPLFLLVDLRWTPVADPGCVCVWQGWSPRPPWNVDDVTRAMSKGGVCACECPRVGVFFKFSEGGWRHADNVQGGGGACEKSCIRAWTPPPFQKSWIRAWHLPANSCQTRQTAGSQSRSCTSIPNFCYSSIDILTNTDSEADLYPL